MGLSSLIWVMVQRDVKTSTPSLNFYFRTFHYFLSWHFNSAFLDTHSWQEFSHTNINSRRTKCEIPFSGSGTDLDLRLHPLALQKEIILHNKESRLELWNVLRSWETSQSNLIFSCLEFSFWGEGRKGVEMFKMINADPLHNKTRQSFLWPKTIFQIFWRPKLCDVASKKKQRRLLNYANKACLWSVGGFNLLFMKPNYIRCRNKLSRYCFSKSLKQFKSWPSICCTSSGGALAAFLETLSNFVELRRT